MARSRIVSGRAVIRAPKRQTSWVASAALTDRSTLGAATAVLDQFFSITEPVTVVRTRGTLWVASDQTAANESPFGALGFAVVTDQARAIGVTAVPTPTTDQPSDSFFVWEPWFADARFASGVGFAMRTFYEYKFDSKAMRKVQESQDIVITIENASATDGALYILQFRMLLKLH